MAGAAISPAFYLAEISLDLSASGGIKNGLPATFWHRKLSI